MGYKRIVLVNPFPYYAEGINESTVYPPLGLATIAAYLEKYAKVTCKVIDANILEQLNDSVLKEIKDFNADIVGIQLNVVTAQSGSELSKMVKKELHLPVVIGGPFSSPKEYKSLLEDTSADCIVIGEGEVTFNEIVQGKKLKDIQGIAYLDKSELKQTEKRPLIEDIDSIPFPAWHMLPNLKIYRSRSRKIPMVPIFTSRGCPYKCTFCTSSVKEGPFANVFRARSPENVIAEIEHLVKNLGIKQIDVLDDNFTFDMKRAEQILDLLIAKKIKIKINIQNGVRADKLTRDMVFKMKKAGVYKTGVGIESSNVAILNSIKKGLNPKSVEQALKWFREAGIITVGFIMLGFPKDTEQTIQDTIDFSIRTNPSIANFMTVLPFPGTELYNDIKAQGLFIKQMDKGSNVGFYGDDFSFETPHLKKETISYYQKRAYRQFYFRPTKIFEIAKDIRSFNELKWTLGAAKPLMKRIMGALLKGSQKPLKRKENKQALPEVKESPSQIRTPN